MSKQSKWTRDLNATVMVQTMEYLQEHSKNLGLSIGEVIDRLVVNIQAPSSEIAAAWVCEQFTLSTSKLNEDDLKNTIMPVLTPSTVASSVHLSSSFFRTDSRPMISAPASTKT